jgi:hypothetical protein
LNSFRLLVFRRKIGRFGSDKVKIFANSGAICENFDEVRFKSADFAAKNKSLNEFLIRKGYFST